MTLCPRHKEITAVLQRGAWPPAGESGLLVHVESCRVCGDAVLLAQSFRSARADSIGAARLQSPGLLWWRAQLRRRNAAMQQVARPVLGAQIFALAVYVVVAAGLVISQAKHGLRWFTWLTGVSQARAFHLESLWPTALMRPEWNLGILFPCLIVLGIFSCAVLYFAADRDHKRG